jgi:hypothetical protein
MDLQLATTDDIIEELRNRQLNFLLVAMETSDSGEDAGLSIAGQGRSKRSLLRLCQMAMLAFERQ